MTGPTWNWRGASLVAHLATPIVAFGLGGLPFHESARGDEPATILEGSTPAPPALLTPEAAQAALVPPPGCRAELVAAEPDIVDPVALAFDERGRLWVVEYRDYPGGPTPPGPPGAGTGQSRIRVLTDANGDGRYRDAVTFADRLPYATGLMPWRGGVLVTVAGEVRYLADRSGDGVADISEVWLTGFATDNPQLRANSPMLDPDGWVVIANGLRGGAIRPGPDNPWGLDPDREPVSISGRDLRFDPFTGQIEALTGQSQFGLAFDADGSRLTCSNRNPCKQVVFDEADVARPGVRLDRVERDILPAGPQSRVFPLSEAWTTSAQHAGQFTAACGVTVYRGSRLPTRYDPFVFVCEPTGSLVHGAALVRRGLTWETQPERDDSDLFERAFLASPDPGFRPVNLAHGPDGALYVCDMARAVIEHPEFMPSDAPDRQWTALGADQGRIWRIVRSDDAADSSRPEIRAEAPPTSDSLSVPRHLARTVTPSDRLTLLEWLDSSDGWHQDTAFRLLTEGLGRRTERSRDHTVPTTAADENPSPPSEDEGIDALRARLASDPGRPGAGRLLRLLARHGDLSVDEVLAARQFPATERIAWTLGFRHHADDGILRQAARSRLTDLLTRPRRDRTTDEAATLATLLRRQSWADATADSPETADWIVADFLGPNDEDRDWRRRLMLVHAGTDLPALTVAMFNRLRTDARPSVGSASPAESVSPLGHSDFASDAEIEGDLTFLAEALARSRQADGVARVLSAVFDDHPLRGESPLTDERMRRFEIAWMIGVVRPPAGRPGLLTEAMSRLPAPTQAAYQAWVKRLAVRWSESTWDWSRHRPEMALVPLLGTDDALTVLAPLVSGGDDDQLTAALETLTTLPPEATAGLLIERLATATPRLRHALVAPLAQSPIGATALVAELEAGRIVPLELTDTVRRALARHRAPALVARLERWLAPPPPSDRATVIASYRAGLAGPHDLPRGRAVFEKQCAVCHRVGSLGQAIGPDISDTYNKTPEYLLIHILDPNRAVDSHYFQVAIEDTSGRVLSGLIESETGSSLTLRQADGQTVVLARDEIETIKNLGVSLMPEGFEQAISVAEMGDVIAYLRSWRRLPAESPGSPSQPRPSENR